MLNSNKGAALREKPTYASGAPNNPIGVQWNFDAGVQIVGICGCRFPPWHGLSMYI